MQPSTTNLPDNLKSRISRLYIDNREFKDEKTGNPVKYNRLVVEVLVKDEIFNIEFKPDPKDIAILKLADVVDKPSQQAF